MEDVFFCGEVETDLMATEGWVGIKARAWHSGNSMVEDEPMGVSDIVDLAEFVGNIAQHEIAPLGPHRTKIGLF